MATRKKKSTDPIAPALRVGELLLAGFREELTSIKHPTIPKQNIWGTMPEVMQREALDRFGRKIRHHFTQAFHAILTNDIPAITCTLAAVTFGSKGIKGTLEINRSSAHRHELSDFSGRQVIVILPEDLDAYLESMSSVKAAKDQTELALVPAGAEEKDPLDEGKFTTMTKETLQALASDLAEKIDEPDAVEAVEDWDRKHLIDYIEFAEAKVDAGNGDNSGSEQTAK